MLSSLCMHTYIRVSIFCSIGLFCSVFYPFFQVAAFIVSFYYIKSLFAGKGRQFNNFAWTFNINVLNIFLGL